MVDGSPAVVESADSATYTDANRGRFAARAQRTGDGLEAAARGVWVRDRRRRYGVGPYRERGELGLELGGRKWLGEVKALDQLALEVAEGAPGLFVLNPFGHNADSELGRELDGGEADRGIRRVGAHPRHERPV